MKIINSHYIPLPEPHWLIVENNGLIYEQLGTMTIIEEDKEGYFGYTTHSHPVIANAIADEYDESRGDGRATNCALAPADGRVLADIELEDCIRLCPTNHRVVPYLKFNLVAMKFLSYVGYQEFDLEQCLDCMRSCKIRLDFPQEELQEVQLTMSGSAGVVLIESDLSGLYFVAPIGKPTKELTVMVDSDKILMEFVNQARVYLKINPKYRFHFTTANEKLKDVVEEINNHLEDYLERKED